MRENEGKWESASARDLERMEALSRAIVNRLLHDPTARMKELRDDRVHARMAFLRDLFDLEVEGMATPAGEQPAATPAAEQPAAPAEQPATPAAEQPAAPEGERLAEVRELRRR